VGGRFPLRSNIPRSALCATLDTYNFYLHIRIEVNSKNGLLEYWNSAYTKSSIVAFNVIGLALFLVSIVYLFEIGDLKMLNYINLMLLVNFTLCAVVPNLLIIRNSNMIEYAKNNFWK
jgi:hypothetical protein